MDRPRFWLHCSIQRKAAFSPNVVLSAIGDNPGEQTHLAGDSRGSDGRVCTTGNSHHSFGARCATRCGSSSGRRFHRASRFRFRRRASGEHAAGEHRSVRLQGSCRKAVPEEQRLLLDHPQGGRQFRQGEGSLLPQARAHKKEGCDDRSRSSASRACARANRASCTSARAKPSRANSASSPWRNAKPVKPESLDLRFDSTAGKLRPALLDLALTDFAPLALGDVRARIPDCDTVIESFRFRSLVGLRGFGVLREPGRVGYIVARSLARRKLYKVEPRRRARLAQRKSERRTSCSSLRKCKEESGHTQSSRRKHGKTRLLNADA